MDMSEIRSRPQVVGVMSSARLNGNTATLVREALKGAEVLSITKEGVFVLYQGRQYILRPTIK